MRKLKYLALLILALATLLIALSSCVSGEILDHEHNFVARTFKSGCTEDGRREEMCILCGKINLLEVLPASGHKPSDWQIKHEASCVQNFTREKICTACGISVETDVGDKLEHTYVDLIVQGTCVKPEHTLHTCSSCGDSYESDFSSVKAEHTPDEWVVVQKATCQSQGTVKKYCKICGEELETKQLSVSDQHDYTIESFPSDGDNMGYTKYTCKVCAHVETINHAATLAPSQIYQMIVGSMVRVEAYDKNGQMFSVGSGFFISDNGYIATNYHVISGAAALKIVLYSNLSYDVVTVKGYDSAQDIAVLKIEETSTPYLKLSTEPAKTGDPVYALGSPLGVDNVFTSGMVSSPAINVGGKRCIAFTAPISPGNSGGPLVNGKGEVVGINTQFALDGQNFNFAIMASQITNLDKENTYTVEDVYLREMKANALSVLSNYISLNYTSMDGEDIYILRKIVSEEGSQSYGVVIDFVYDSEKEKVFVDTYLVANKVNRFKITLVIDGVKDAYGIETYDYANVQTTMIGTVNASVEITKEYSEEMFAKALNFTTFKYNESGSNYSSLKTIVYQSYVYILQNLDKLFAESNTLLTLEHFNMVAPLVEENK